MNKAASIARVLALALALGGCALFVSPGEPADDFLSPQIARAYIPLRSTNYLVVTHIGAAVAIAPGIAVTNAHNANLVAPASIIGDVKGYDLLFIRTQQPAIVRTASPQMGEAVIAYGQGKSGGLRVSRGTVKQFWPAAFGFESDGGPGFSGGPVVDAKTGALVGITYGYIDGEGGRLMVAYSMDFVAEKLAQVQAATGPK